MTDTRPPQPDVPSATADTESMTADTESMTADTGADTAVARSDTVLGPGDSIGRFSVRGVLGSGGMAVVLSAHDAELDRLVAIKLIRLDLRFGPDAEETTSRLLREARAMAKLHHPNVVAVHDAGTHEGQVYIVMEQIDGGNLREELARRRAHGDVGWLDIVGLFAAAGRGLVAAHEKGLVHRDFKPDNVLIDRDGGVKVADFGLVATHGDAVGSSKAGAAQLLGDPLTSAGSVLGTPAYMAPEQHVGAKVDARCDQFAFCVSLYESLYGQLPFSGADRVMYVEAMESGSFRPPPADSTVPAWIRPVLERGMSADPDDRFASMKELLDEFDTSADARLPGLRVRVMTLLALFGVGFVVVLLAPFLKANPTAPLSRLWMLAIDGGFFAGTALIMLVFRQDLSRTAFNRRLFGSVLVTFAASFALVAVSAVLELTLRATGILHLLVWAIALGVVSVTWLPLVAPSAAALAIGLFVAAAHPAWFYYISAACIAALVINALVVIGNRKDLYPPKH